MTKFYEECNRCGNNVLADCPYCSPLLVALKKIRDLARTGTAPMAMNMTEEQWKQYKLNRCAYIAQTAIKLIKEN